MEENKELAQAEELSTGIDSLNAGRQPASQDSEINECLELAFLIQQTGAQTEPPAALIAEMADTLAFEIQKNNRRRRLRRLMSGVAGAAAAVLLALWYPFYPLPAEDQVAHQLKAGQESHMKEPVYPNDQQNSPAGSAPAAQNGQKRIDEKPRNSREAKKSDHTQEELVAMNVQESPASREPVKQAAGPQEEPQPNAGEQRPMLMARTGIGQEAQDKSSSIPIRVMVIPGYEMQSITVDASRTVIEQQYRMEDQEEILLTQKPHYEGTEQNQQTGQAMGAAMAAQPLAKQGQGQVNRITVTVDQYDITVAGKKPAAELLKIAESLVPKEITP